MAFTKSEYDFINLAVSIKGQADRLGIEHNGVPHEGVVARIAQRAVNAEARIAELEAKLAARQPSGDDREATEAEIDKAARVLHMAKCCSLSGDSPHDFPEASELFAAGVVLNAVPLTATPDVVTELRAERDAALAAIERVQEILSLHNPNGRLVKEVLAALDVAPEPEAKP